MIILAHALLCMRVLGGGEVRRVGSMCHRVCVHVEVRRQLEGVTWDLEIKLRWSGSAARVFTH